MAKRKKTNLLKLNDKFTRKAKQVQILGRLMAETLEELQEIQEKLRRLEAKPKRKRKRRPKCQSSEEQRVSAFRLTDTATPAVLLSGLH